ncbi:hypothetical protein ACS5PN_27970 [Roseateles sp. NT4]|uniref:hypothetical protein n=1 Tax=Roseateles sp. NT4 TaxID=3453715 RepID=UPI003EEF0378
MSPDLDTSSGLRRAALALHALSAEDRAWLLQRLSPAQREALDALLVELKELGIPPDQGVIRAALSQPAASSVFSEEEARGLCLALEREPPALQSLLLASLGATERANVLTHRQAQLQALPSAVAAPDWTPTLRQALLESWREVAAGNAA